MLVFFNYYNKWGNDSIWSVSVPSESSSVIMFNRNMKISSAVREDAYFHKLHFQN